MKNSQECRAIAEREIHRSQEASHPHMKHQLAILSGQWLAMARVADLHAQIERELFA